MLILYTLLLLLLGLAVFLVERRARSLERKYTRVAVESSRLAHEPFRPGNSNRGDPYQFAKRQYQLGLLTEKRDKLEAKQYRWQHCADRLRGVLSKLRAWKGRTLPYTFGVVDVSLLIGLVDHLGFRDRASLTTLVQYVERLLSQ